MKRMIRLSRKADYALIALGYLSERTGRVSSARQIAGDCQLPLPLLMNLLKRLHQRGILRSVRGTAGGYQVAVDLHDLSLFELCAILDPHVSKKLALHGPAQALQYRLRRFMQDVSVADLVLPGRRIDVPLEMVGVARDKAKQLVNVG